MFTTSSGAEGAAIEHVTSACTGEWRVYTRWTTGVVTHVDVELIGVYVVQTDEWDRAQIFLDRIL